MIANSIETNLLIRPCQQIIFPTILHDLTYVLACFSCQEPWVFLLLINLKSLPFFLFFLFFWGEIPLDPSLYHAYYLTLKRQ